LDAYEGLSNYKIETGFFQI